MIRRPPLTVKVFQGLAYAVSHIDSSTIESESIESAFAAARRWVERMPAYLEDKPKRKERHSRIIEFGGYE